MRGFLVEGVVQGYGALLKRAGLFLVLLALVGLSSLIIALPLWLWATRASGSYTLIITILIGSALVGYGVLKIWRNVQNRKTRLKEILLRILKKLVFTVLMLLLLYGVLWLFAAQMHGIAIAALLLYLILLGYVRYARKRSYPPG